MQTFKILALTTALFLPVAGTMALAQDENGWKSDDGLRRRAEIEAEYGVKDAEQKFDTRAEMMADLNRTGAEYFMYVFDDPVMTPAPKGYKPFYVSYMGRHGARWGIGNSIYEDIRKVLADAHEAGKLTDAGENLWRRYEKYYPSVAYREGDLTASGQEQLRRIADILYRDFPAVFKGETRAEALSTPVPRVMMTMFSFLSEIQELDRDFSFTMDAGRAFCNVLEPTGPNNPYRTEIHTPAEARKSASAMADSLIDYKAFCGRYFNDIEHVDSTFGVGNFMSGMRTVVVGAQCIPGLADRFDDIFTPEELFSLWEVRNYGGYVRMGRSPLTESRWSDSYGATLRDMIEKADRDIASGDIQLSLRFSHDTAVLPLVCFMRLDNFGAVVDDPYEVKNFWRSDGVPMAANLQLVFFRSRRSPDILVKVLYNGHEASLPIPQAAPSFYSWQTFKDFYLNLIAGAEAKS